MIDSGGHLNVRFYAFGNDQSPAKVMDAHIVSRPLTKAECKGDAVKDLETNLYVQKCHKDCDPLAGETCNRKKYQVLDLLQVVLIFDSRCLLLLFLVLILQLVNLFVDILLTACTHLGHNPSLVLHNIKISLNFAEEFSQTNFAFVLVNILIPNYRAMLR